MSGVVYRCVICADLVPLDDAECPNVAAARCICLRCFELETGRKPAPSRGRMQQDIDRAEDALRTRQMGPETAAEYGEPLPDEDV